MLALSGTTEVFVFDEYVDMRKGFEGLSAIIEAYFSETATSGAYFAFFNRSKNRIKVLYWDNDGFVIWYKRLEKGKFSLDQIRKNPIGRRDFLMLLEGIIPKSINRRYKHK